MAQVPSQPDDHSEQLSGLLWHRGKGTRGQGLRNQAVGIAHPFVLRQAQVVLLERLFDGMFGLSVHSTPDEGETVAIDGFGRSTSDGQMVDTECVW